MNKKLLLSGLAVSSIVLVSCNKSEAEIEAENFEIFKETVSNEISYTGTLEQSLSLNLKLVPHVFDGEQELSKADAEKLGFSLAETESKQNMVNVYDEKEKTFLKLTGEEKADTIEEFYYIENDTEYKCFFANERNPETNIYEKVKKRESLDKGHIETVRGIQKIEDIDIFDGVDSYDDLLGKFGDLVHTLPGAEEFDMSGFKIETKKNADKYEMVINAPLKFNILGQIDVDANAVGTLTYDDKKIDSFVVDVDGSMSQEQTKTVEGVEKKYLQKNALTLNVNVNLAHELTNKISEEDLQAFKAIEAKPARKVGSKCDSIVGNEAFLFNKDETKLPKTLATLENSDIKFYTDKKHTNEIDLQEIKNKTFDQEFYAVVTPKEGYALVVEVVNDPTPFWGQTKTTAKEYKISEESSYAIQEVVNITGGWVECPFNGEKWTDITINDNKVEIADSKLTLESGDTYKVEYKYVAPKEEK